MSKSNVIRYHNLEQGSPPWKEFRKGKIGSSMAASIMGVGFKTPLQLFEDIIEDKDYEPNSAMIRGNMMEPIARKWLNNKYNTDLQPVVVSHPNPIHDWHISSIDGLCKREDGSIFVCEIKCPGKIDHDLAMNGIVPMKYIPQLYHILEDLPGVDKIMYLSYHPDSQKEIWVEREEISMAQQFAKESEFFSKIINCRAPDPIDADWVKIYDQEAISHSERYQNLSEQIEYLMELKESVKRDILIAIGDVKRAKIKNLSIQKMIRKGAIEYDKIEALKNIDLDPYRKQPIVSWRIS